MNEEALGPEAEIIHLLPPWFHVTLSINGHLETYRLSSRMYSYLMDEKDIDPLNIAEVWTYLSNNLLEFLMSITDEVGPIDPDRAKLIGLTTDLLVAPSATEGIIDCDDCEDGYQDAVEVATGQDEDEDDEDD